MGYRLRLEGKRFGRLSVIERSTEKNKYGAISWICSCDCGNVVKVKADGLKNGSSQSCGCLRTELRIAINKSRATRNVRTNTNIKRTYKSWSSMKSRCSNTNDPGYKNYGGRGIKMCDRWNNFDNFYLDMGERPQGLTIERIDNDGNYEPGNCKWATWGEQQRNKRHIYLVDRSVW